MRKVIPAILPYLRVKRQQAEVLLRFLEHRQEGKSLSNLRHEWYVEVSRGLYDEMKILNKRRPAEMVDQVIGAPEE